MPAIAKITIPKRNFFNMIKLQNGYCPGVEYKALLARRMLNIDSCIDYKEGRTSIDTF
jgi:hypothetical protein